MTPSDPNLDDLKKAWTEMGRSLGMPAPDSDPGDLKNKKTALDRLRYTYLRFQILAIIFIVFSLNFFTLHWGDIGPIRWLGIAYPAYFLICFLMDRWLWKGIRSIDPLTMGAAQVAEKALYYRKRHLQCIIFLAPAAIAMLLMTAYSFRANSYLIAGMACGFLFGITIAIFQLRRFLGYYRSLAQ